MKIILCLCIIVFSASFINAQTAKDTTPPTISIKHPNENGRTYFDCCKYIEITYMAYDESRVASRCLWKYF